MRAYFPKAGHAMALVLCTGVDSSLLTTRRLILESAGHKVVTVTDEKSLLAACKEHKFEVAVVGKMLTQNMKRRIAALLRTHCPEAKNPRAVRVRFRQISGRC